MDGLTAAIVDTASALTAVRLQSEMSTKLLDKALDQQGQMAMSLLQALPSASPAGSGEIIDILA
ncbi:MAG: putative motility protein [bacterium]|nr:putative motility protein [bacterium]